MPEPVGALLLHRGVSDIVAAERYLRPQLAHLLPPDAMRDLDRAVDRIATAVRDGQTILVHGDYDVDGMTSTAMMTRVLRNLGGTVMTFIPNRMTDGYDLGDAGVRAAVAERAALVITCDCGTSAIDPVARLNAAGIDVIITDHHLPGGPLPAALAVLNPRRPDCAYPDKDLVAAGVAFKLAIAVTRALGGDEAFVYGLLDLVALATIADVAPLRGENRVFARHGLRMMPESRLAGLRAMIRAAGLENKELTAGRIGFTLAPRLNAAGRVGSAMRGVQLLLTDDEGVAMGIARELEELNRHRQELDRETLDAARKQLDRLDLSETFGIVLAGEGWHAGVIGIVASRIVEETARPTMLVAVERGVGKGSGRSIPAFDLHGALTACKQHFTRFGGHRAAAGITLPSERIAAFAADFNAIARERLTPDDLMTDLRIDIELPVSRATRELIDALRAFEPYGIGNPAPTFLARGVRTDAPVKRVGESGVRTRFADAESSIDAIAWDFAQRADRIDWTAPLDLAYRLELDEWNGRVRVQARVADVRPAAASSGGGPQTELRL